MSVITLGGRGFPVAPLTLGQMRRAGPAFVRIGFDTPDAVDAIPGVTIPELRAALKLVLALIGIDLVDVPPGESRPGEPSTGPISTAP